MDMCSLQKSIYVLSRNIVQREPAELPKDQDCDQ